jgi:hypothetical protein
MSLKDLKRVQSLIRKNLFTVFAILFKYNFFLQKVDFLNKTANLLKIPSAH